MESLIPFLQLTASIFFGTFEPAPQIIKLNATNEVQEKVNYAWEISEGDEEFVYTLNSENDLWTHDRRHMQTYLLCWTLEAWGEQTLPNQSNCWRENREGASGVFTRRHSDWGLCGFSDGYFRGIVKDERFLTDWKWQVRQCYNEYERGTAFYGKANNWKSKKQFIIKQNAKTKENRIT